MIPRFLASSLLCLLAFSCSFQDKSKNLDNWLGKYGYEEEPIKAIAGYNMVMIWELSINKSNDSYQGILEVNGQQTFLKLLTDVSGDSSSIVITYNNLLEGSFGNQQKGDTLFVLSKNSKSLKTKWFVLEPRLLEKPPRECNCFTKNRIASVNFQQSYIILYESFNRLILTSFDLKALPLFPF